jgi:hypothetical protein
MEIIKEICQDNFIQTLGLKYWSSVDLLERVNDLLTGNAFVIFLENFTGKRVEIIVRNNDNLKQVWKSIQVSYERMKKGVNLKNLSKRFDLCYKNTIFDKDSTVSSLGLIENETIKFKRKKPRKVQVHQTKE